MSEAAFLFGPHTQETTMAHGAIKGSKGSAYSKKEYAADMKEDMGKGMKPMMKPMMSGKPPKK